MRAAILVPESLAMRAAFLGGGLPALCYDKTNTAVVVDAEFSLPSLSTSLFVVSLFVSQNATESIVAAICDDAKTLRQYDDDVTSEDMAMVRSFLIFVMSMT